MRTLVAAAVLGALSACATVRVTPIRLEDSQSLIRSAEALGAATVPQAAHHLDLARFEQNEARKLANLGDARAALVHDRAIADAELAVVLTQEAQVTERSLSAARDVEALRGAR